MNTARPTGFLANGSRNLVDWLTGIGFLMLHATCFFVALVVLIPWNVYSSPGDFWVAEPLIRWAFLLGFHALLVGVWSLIHNVILKDEDSDQHIDSTTRTWQRAQAQANPFSFRMASRPGDAASKTASALMAEEWARQWLIQSGDEFVGDEQLSDGSGAARQSIQTTNDMDAAEESAEFASGSIQDYGTAQPWPRPPTAGSVTENTDLLIETARQNEPTVAKDTPRQPGPLAAAARASNKSTSSAESLDPELEWRWIEAAASAWLTRKERENYLDAGPHQSSPSGRDASGP